jgi:hypothetical protein
VWRPATDASARNVDDADISSLSFPSIALFAWFISHLPALFFSQNKPATNNQPTVLFFQNESAPAISHQLNEHAACPFSQNFKAREQLGAGQASLHQSRVVDSAQETAGNGQQRLART